MTRIIQDRRSFLAGMSAAGVMGLLGDDAAQAEGLLPAETTSVRFAHAPTVCVAPQYVAEQLLRAEGFTDFSYVKTDSGIPATEKMADGDLDFSLDFSISFIIPIDAGAKIKVLSGVHVGCYELIAAEGIRSVLDLKGKRVGIGWGFNTDPQVFVSVMATYVGLDPTKDIIWVSDETPPEDLFLQGKIDAFLGFPTQAQEFRNKKVGHVIVNSILDKPWSQYFCCMLASSAAYAENYPNATKRVLRAVLRAADMCISDPRMVARLLVDNGYEQNFDLTLQALREIRYAPWREFDPEDTMRFFSLRLHEAGLIKSSPQKIVADGTDWRFFNEVKRGLKA